MIYQVSIVILFISIFGVVFGDSATSDDNNVEFSPFRYCDSDGVSDVICNYANCSYAKGQNVQQNKYINLNSIRNSQPPGYSLKLQVFIRGDQDCHIILSPNDTTNSLNYNIVIGGYANTQSYLYKGGMVALTETPDVLPLLAPAEFTIKITKSGEFEIRKRDAVVLQTVDRNPLPIKFIKFGSFEKANLEYFFDCRGNENEVEAIDSDSQGNIADTMETNNHMVMHTASMFNQATNILTSSVLNSFIVLSIHLTVQLY